MRKHHIVTALMVLLSLGWSSAWAQSKPAPAPAAAAQSAVSEAANNKVGGDYILGRDDVIEVSLIGSKDFGSRARVQSDGTVQLPLIGKVEAADRTTGELATTVQAALEKGGYFTKPVVSVEVVSFASRYVTVLGAVGSPGLVPMNRAYRMSELLARVGGVKDNAADYVILRSEDGKERKLMVRDVAAGDDSKDPYVSPGDKIFAPTAENFYIYGQVSSPGQYPLTSDMTVRMAIAKGGGLTESGNDKNVEVTRGGKKMKGALGDKVEAGDVLFVKERLF